MIKSIQFLTLSLCVFLIAGTVNSLLAGPMPYRCVTGDTLVAGMNGSKIRIRDIKNQEQVSNRLGEKSTVLALVSGTAPRTMIQIVLQSGKQVIATTDHPFVQADGSVIEASKIHPKERLLTVDGPEKVVQIKRIRYSGKVYNLKLSGAGKASHFFYTNGILSGDLEVQNTK